MQHLQTARPIKKCILCALFSALLAMLAQLSLPLPIGMPLTLQTFAVALCGYLLGWKHGILSVFLYLLLGGVGLPVFSGFRGGIGILLGLTGGYLFGFLFLSALCGLGGKRKNKGCAILLGLGGLALCHAWGVVWFSAVSQSPTGYAFSVASLPYLLKDAVSVGGAYFVALAVGRRVWSFGS